MLMVALVPALSVLTLALDLTGSGHDIEGRTSVTALAGR